MEALKKANLSLKRELQQALDNASLNTELEQEVARLTRENLVSQPSPTNKPPAFFCPTCVSSGPEGES